MKKLLFLLFIAISFQGISQQLTGQQLLEKAIQYHDPNGNWETFKGILFITMETPNKPNRDSEIHIDLPNQFFLVKATRGKNTTEYSIDKDSIQIVYNGNKNLSAKELKEKGLSKERAKQFKNYYTYLYGLPMKLKDKGTIIHPKVNLEPFLGDKMLVLKVTYPKEIGKDTWYFYFNKDTYKMEAYQFFHDEEKNDGEYISLDGEEIINGIKMPKIRAWYTNKDQKHLGTDILKSSK